ncbi:hypothetical protein MKW98_028494 [Papaver atlanticum]|uniref:Uncharacterized protein n=1 Tax=Papaver atlanticum TaxID=357466 RepID=A0AAD4TDC3_9MAGN|nr:hypothetical protein MKW98_028494 [Papaver atlanticum]
MDSFSLGSLNQGGGVDIFKIYQRYCDVRARSNHAGSREALAQVKLVELRGKTRRNWSSEFCILYPSCGHSMAEVPIMVLVIQEVIRYELPSTLEIFLIGLVEQDVLERW